MRVQGTAISPPSTASIHTSLAPPPCQRSLEPVISIGAGHPDRPSRVGRPLHNRHSRGGGNPSPSTIQGQRQNQGVVKVRYPPVLTCKLRTQCGCGGILLAGGSLARNRQRTGNPGDLVQAKCVAARPCPRLDAEPGPLALEPVIRRSSGRLPGRAQEQAR